MKIVSCFFYFSDEVYRVAQADLHVSFPTLIYLIRFKFQFYTIVKLNIVSVLFFHLFYQFVIETLIPV